MFKFRANFDYYVARICNFWLSHFRSAVIFFLSTSFHQATVPALPAPQPVPEPHGILPLTLLDDMAPGSSIVMGWLIEGTLDLSVISAALDRLVAKWPLLAGRLESDPKTKYRIRFSVTDTYPKEYTTYGLTSSDSAAPVSNFFSLPLPVMSVTPPTSLFLHSSTPRLLSTWISRQHPLTCWHVTRFPPAPDGKQYACIGVTVPHKAFDGVGISIIVHALEAELLGREWEPPRSLPHEGLNVNVLQEALDAAMESRKQKVMVAESGKSNFSHGFIPYKNLTPATTKMTDNYRWWHIWQKVWHQARSSVVILPLRAVTMLVDRTKKEMEAFGTTDVHLSTGDILIAWFFKTVYSDGTPHSRIVYCSSIASARPFFSANLRLDRYAHNCFFPMPYPTISVGDLQSSPLHAIAYSFAVARNSMSLSHPLTVYNTLIQSSKDESIVRHLPYHADAQETLAVSNTSITRTADIDWTGAGGKTTLCRYMDDCPALLTNRLFLAGRAHDGGTILDVVLTKARLARLKAGVQELINSSG